MLFKARPSRLRRYCSYDASSRRKRQTEDDEFQHLNKYLMTLAVNSSTDEIVQVRRISYLVFIYMHAEGCLLFVQLYLVCK